MRDLEAKCLTMQPGTEQEPRGSLSNIYYHRELLCNSLDGLRVDLITVSSKKGIVKEREPRLTGLFPDIKTKRACQFTDKKVQVKGRLKNGI